MVVGRLDSVLLLVIALVLFEGVLLVEELACMIEMTRNSTNMASILFSFKARLASEDFEDGLRLACGDLAMVGNHALFDLLVGLCEERPRTEVREVRLHIAEDAIFKVIHEVKDLSLLEEFDPDSIASLDLVLKSCNPAVEIARHMLHLGEIVLPLFLLLVEQYTVCGRTLEHVSLAGGFEDE